MKLKGRDGLEGNKGMEFKKWNLRGLGRGRREELGERINEQRKQSKKRG